MVVVSQDSSRDFRDFKLILGNVKQHSNIVYGKPRKETGHIILVSSIGNVNFYSTMKCQEFSDYMYHTIAQLLAQDK